LTGRLELRGKPCASFEDGRNVAIASVRGRARAATVRGEHLVLRGTETVLLDGPLDVLLGSSQSARGVRWGSLKRAMVERVTQVLDVGPKEPLWFCSLVAGDVIWVQGRLERPDKEALPDIDWRLVPEVELMPVLYDGVPRVTLAGWWRVTAAAMAAIVLYFGIAKLAYETGALELATATPYRKLALQRLRDRYSYTAEHDPRAVDALETVQLARGDYCQLETRLRELGYLERAARISRMCDDSAERDAVALCLMREGKFEEASAVLEPSPKVRGKLYPGVDLAVNVDLLAHHPERALSRLEYLAPLDSMSGVASEVVYETKARNQCLMLALQAKIKHDSNALSALRKRAGSPLAQYSCTVLYADLVKGEERMRALESCTACRAKRSILALPWLLGVQAACGNGQEESRRCSDWLLEAKPSMRRPQWDSYQWLNWLLYMIPSVEDEVNDYLLHSGKIDSWTWLRDRARVFINVVQPIQMQAPLLDELDRVRHSDQIISKGLSGKLSNTLGAWALDQTLFSDEAPVVHKVVFEQNTCYHPRSWYERELEPRRTLASLIWTAREEVLKEHPILAGEILITALKLVRVLEQRDTAVELMALHH